MDKINDIFISEVESIRAVRGCRPTIILQPLNIDEVQHSKKKGGNSLGIDVEDVPLISKPASCLSYEDISNVLLDSHIQKVPPSATRLLALPARVDLALPQSRPRW